MKWFQEGWLSTFDDLGWNAVCTGALPQTRASIALLSSSIVGSESSSSSTGSSSIVSNASWVTEFSLA